MRAQSAMEYLMTYGWAILIIGIALAALFQLGVFNPGTYAPNLCALPSGLGCLSYYLSSSGTLTVTIQNSLQDPINVTALGCSQNKTITNMQAPYNPPSNQVYIPIGGSYTFSLACSGASSLKVGQLYTGYLIINYTDDVTSFPTTVFGKLALKVS